MLVLPVYTCKGMVLNLVLHGKICDISYSIHVMGMLYAILCHVGNYRGHHYFIYMSRMLNEEAVIGILYQTLA